MRERWRRNVETLASTSDLSAWLVESELTFTRMRVSRAVLAEARELREAIDAGVRAAIDGAAPPEDAYALVDSWLKHAGTRPALVLAGGEPLLAERAPADSPRRAVGMAALDAAEMLGVAEQRARIRICSADDCSARFYDRSPAGGRRWCSMETCGNVAKARRHRDRHRRAAT